MTRCLLVVTFASCLLVSLAHAQQPSAKRYTDQQIRETPAAFFFDHLGRPEPGYEPFAARLALGQQYRSANDQAKKTLWDTAFALVDDPANDVFARLQACYLLVSFDPAAATPELNRLLYGDEQNRVRAAAASALGMVGSPEARRILDKAAAAERDPYVREWITKAIDGLAQRAANTPQKTVKLWLVRDWIRIRNNGPTLKSVELERYYPIVDEEQIVLGRWIATRDDGQGAPALTLTRVDADSERNLIHTYLLDEVPGRQDTVIEVTSIVARHAKEPLTGPCPIPDKYPPEVTPYLASTPAVPADDPMVVARAKEIRAKTSDAYEVAKMICDTLKALPYTPGLKEGMSTPAFVLTYGGVCCPSADTAVALFRACGVPAQLTYCPLGEFHGITQAYFAGYGWYRIESTCGGANVSPTGFGVPCVFNTPIAMEKTPTCFLWPYFSSDMQGLYRFKSEGKPAPTLQMAVAYTPNREIRYFPEPFKHLESGSAAEYLGTVPFAGPWAAWDDLGRLSKQAILGLQLGEFKTVTEQLPGVDEYIAKGLNYTGPEK
ncbi:MAG: HEAT repeat domain-containing protein, partial [Bacteroidota bacterium]